MGWWPSSADAAISPCPATACSAAGRSKRPRASASPLSSSTAVRSRPVRRWSEARPPCTSPERVGQALDRTLEAGQATLCPARSSPPAGNGSPSGRAAPLGPHDAAVERLDLPAQRGHLSAKGPVPRCRASRSGRRPTRREPSARSILGSLGVAQARAPRLAGHPRRKTRKEKSASSTIAGNVASGADGTDQHRRVRLAGGLRVAQSEVGSTLGESRRCARGRGGRTRRGRSVRAPERKRIAHEVAHQDPVAVGLEAVRMVPER